MAIDHSSLQGPPAIAREDSSSSSTAYVADSVTPPPWAHSVDIENAGGIIRLATSGTDDAVLDADYFSVPDAAGYRLQLQGEEEVGQARVFYVAAADNTVDYGFVYRGPE